MLDKLSIRGLLIAGFGLVVAILIINSLLALRALNVGGQGVAELTQSDYPAVARVNEVEQLLQESAAFLGFYLMSEEDEHRDAWLATMSGTRSTRSSRTSSSRVVPCRASTPPTCRAGTATACRSS